jgi:hypothetical protein
MFTIFSNSLAQQIDPKILLQNLDGYRRTYQVKMLPSQKFRVFKDDKK